MVAFHADGFLGFSFVEELAGDLGNFSGGGIFLEEFSAERIGEDVGVFEFLEELSGGLIPVAGLDGHHALNDGDHAFGDLGVEVPGIGSFGVSVIPELGGEVSIGEGGFAGEHLVPGAAEGIDVAFGIGGFAVLGLFGGHVIDGADGHSGACDPAFEGVLDGACESEVGEFDDAFAGDEDVGGLDVAMDDPVAVGVQERGGDLFDDFEGASDGDASADIEESLDVGAVDVLHGDVVVALVFSGVEDGDDVFVSELGGIGGFGAEAAEEGLIFSFFGSEDLEGDFSSESLVDSEIDSPHTARADFFLDLVGAEFAEREFLTSIGTSILLTGNSGHNHTQSSKFTGHRRRAPGLGMESPARCIVHDSNGPQDHFESNAIRAGVRKSSRCLGESSSKPGWKDFRRSIH